MCRPAVSLPTKEIARMSGWSQMPFTVSCSPCTTLSTPGGSPASSASCASIIAAPGSRSDGLSTMVLPAVTATGNIHRGIMAGKLKGQMPAVTPSGWRMLYESMPVLTFSAISPIWYVAMPHACSTTSRPRNTSPLASASVLPCSSVMMAASGSMWSRMSCWYLSMTRERVVMGVLRHLPNAVLQLATASLSSALVHTGTSDTSSCVAGLSTSTKRVDAEGRSLPSMSI
mmetsp:Transcript_18877/g.47033  ORF Transcript_18877/g.47033 Transcript_18877/m.47033 type:complete len:229 (-) Transcript_18877:85-771(-)